MREQPKKLKWGFLKQKRVKHIKIWYYWLKFWQRVGSAHPKSLYLHPCMF